MAYERRAVTTCDHCGAFEWGTQRRWIVGTHNTGEGKTAVHLCRRCRDEVWYCPDCDDFHPLGQGCPVPTEEEGDKDLPEPDVPPTT